MTTLAGDIGGTHTRLALFESGSREPTSLTTYASDDHHGLPEMVQAFLAAHPATVSAAAFGVAGPVVDGKTETVNLAWPVDDAEMASTLSLEDDRVTLLNDLEANAWGIAWLGDDDLAVVNAGDPDAVGQPGGDLGGHRARASRAVRGTAPTTTCSRPKVAMRTSRPATRCRTSCSRSFEPNSVTSVGNACVRAWAW